MERRGSNSLPRPWAGRRKEAAAKTEDRCEAARRPGGDARSSRHEKQRDLCRSCTCFLALDWLKRTWKRKMKTGHFEMVSMLLAAMILMDIFQVKAEMLDMADNAFDDEYLKCTDRMEIKYIPQLLKEEKANQQLLVDVWEDAASKWEARKTKMVLPVNFKDNHGIALMAYISEAQKQTEFYHLFNKAVKMAGQSRKDYIYDFQFKAFHFYLTKALQLLRKPCEESYKNVVYSSSQVAFIFGGLNQVRFGNFTLAYATKPQPANDQHILLTIHTCFGIAVEKFFDDEDEKIVLIPLNEVFHVSQDVTGNNLILQSTNKTCSHYECAFLGGLKTSGCVENMEYFQPIYVYNPGEKNQKLEDSGMKKQESTNFPGMKSYDSTQIPAPRPGPDPVPGPKTHPSASSGQTLLPPFGTVVILFSASAMLLHSPVA